MELYVVQQNLLGEEAFDPVRRVNAFASFLERTRPHVVVLQELLPWNARALLSLPSLRELYPNALSDLLPDPPWTYVLTRLPRLHRERIDVSHSLHYDCRLTMHPSQSSFVAPPPCVLSLTTARGNP